MYQASYRSFVVPVFSQRPAGQRLYSVARPMLDHAFQQVGHDESGVLSMTLLRSETASSRTFPPVNDFQA